MIEHSDYVDRLSWSLEQKIDHSLYTIENAMSYSDNKAYVSFSGGKDSTVLMSLCRIIKPDIPVVFFNTKNEFPEIYDFISSVDNVTYINQEHSIKGIIDKHGFPLISKEQSQYIREARATKSEKMLQLRLHGRKGNQGKISNKWQHLLKAPFNVSERCCYYLKKKPAMDFEKKTGLMPIIGTMASESRLRKQKYMKTGCNAFELRRPASYPMSIWTTDDVWNYIKKFNVPYCDIYDKGETQTGCMACGFGCHRDNRFERLKESHPRSYEYAMGLTNNNVTYKEAIDYALKREWELFN